MPFLTRRDAVSFCLLARPNNLGIAVLTLGVAAYIGQRSTGAQPFAFLADYLFWTEALLISVIMAGGYWINDVYDFKIDRVNKPNRAFVGARISRKKVLTGYFASLGFVAGASLLLPWYFIGLHYIALIMLYLYAAYFKRAAVVGNLVIASLTSLVVLAGGLLYQLHFALVWLSLFAFVITFIREVTKDVEDIRGDLLFGLHTLPIMVGIRTTKKILLVAYAFMLLCCYLPPIVYYVWRQDIVPAYMAASILLVQIPLAANMLLLARAARPRAFALQSQLLKIYILGGMVSVLLLP